MMTTPFRQDNTEGYTDEQLATLNAAFLTRWAAGDWDGIAYDEAATAFQHEVARR